MTEVPVVSEQKHIRPKKRQPAASASAVKTTTHSNNKKDDDQTLKETASIDPLKNKTPSCTTGSILRRNPKYSSNKNNNHHPGSSNQKNSRDITIPLAEEMVMERKITRRKKNMITTTTEQEEKQSQPTDEEEEPPLIFNSLADLMEFAGTLPSNKSGEETPAMVEAKLEFTCLDPQQYETDQQDDDNEDHQDAFGSFFGQDPNEVNVPAPPPRAFRIISDAIAQWITPQAVAYVMKDIHTNHQYHHNDDTDDDFDDVMATRCAGLMNMLKIHIPSCQNEIQKEYDNHTIVTMMNERQMEKRLGDFLRCLDYRHPMPRLNLAITRALTTIFMVNLIQPVSTTTTSTTDKQQQQVRVPESCLAVGMNADEYRYLTRSAIRQFGLPDEYLEIQQQQHGQARRDDQSSLPIAGIS